MLHLTVMNAQTPAIMSLKNIHHQITRERQMCSIPVLDWVHGLVFTECCVPVVTGGSEAAKERKDTQVTVCCEACQCVPCGKSKMQLLYTLDLTLKLCYINFSRGFFLTQIHNLLNLLTVLVPMILVQQM
jgi:hypothetical protein